jgi:hypothetical protein
MDVGGKGGHVTSVRQNEKKIIGKYEKSKLSEKICLEKRGTVVCSTQVILTIQMWLCSTVISSDF